MTKKYAILGVILVALIGTWVALTLTKNINYGKPSLAEANTIDKIEMRFGTNEEITLALTNSVWRVLPQGYLADSNKANEMVAQLKDLTFADEKPRKGGTFRKYDLHEEQGITVKAYDAGNVVRDIAVGKTAPTRSHTFVRIKNGDKVYSAEGVFRGTFSKKDPLAVVSPTITSFNTADVTHIWITEDGSEYTMMKKVEEVTNILSQNTNFTNQTPTTIPFTNWEASWKDDDADTNAIAGFLSKAGALSSYTFVTEGVAEGMSNYIRMVRVRAQGVEQEIYIVRKEQENETVNYILGVKGRKVLFKVPEAQVTDLLKPIRDF